jgi:V8-like Glu-specific endopeptidase
MRPFALLALAAASFSGSAFAFQPALDGVNTLPRYPTAVTTVNKAVVLAEARKGRPLQFAVGAPLQVRLEQGQWQDSNGLSRWRVRVASAQALSLNLVFSQFHLPEGAELWLYDPSGQSLAGPYTSANHTPEGKLWTGLVQGAEAIIELQVPSAQKDQVRLELESVNHGFKDFFSGASPAKANKTDDSDTQTTSAKASGTCNIDVVCPAGDPWRNEIRSVARIAVGGQFACTGSLVNNVRQNDDPLFLTANHCLIGQTSTTPASSVVFYWNFQTATCGGARTGNVNSSTQSQTGSTLLAGDSGSDFTLVRLNQSPISTFNVYYAGWNASSSTPNSGMSVHHPQGEEKRIAIFNQPAVRDVISLGAGRTVATWRVNWLQGTTEQGSSGGGLWNQNRQIVGVLSGGDAACSNSNPNQNNGLNDFYGRLESAWQASSASSGQLKAWLDPTNTGTLSLCGKNPGGTACNGAPAGSVTPPGGGTPTNPSSGGVSGGGGGAFGAVWGLLLLAGLGRSRKALSWIMKR